MKDWSKYIGKKLPFFETEIGGRIVRVSTYLRPMEEGNIIWQLSTKTRVGNHWSTAWVYLEDMRKLGFLFLALSKFCKENRYMNEETYDEIIAFREKRNHLADRDFKELETRKAFLIELQRKCGISNKPRKTPSIPERKFKRKASPRIDSEFLEDLNCRP